jgi:hypothetical protein
MTVHTSLVTAIQVAVMSLLRKRPSGYPCSQPSKAGPCRVLQVKAVTAAEQPEGHRTIAGNRGKQNSGPHADSNWISTPSAHRLAAR